MFAEAKHVSASNRHQGRQRCCINKDYPVIYEAALLFMGHSLIDYNKPNMDKHCWLSYIRCITELFEGSSYNVFIYIWVSSC